MVIPSSLAQAIREDPDRFLKYLNLDRIANARNPYQEFLRQLRAKFGRTKSGHNMYKYIRRHYSLQNALWKSRTMQSRLPKDYKGAFRKKEYQTGLSRFVPVKDLKGLAKSVYRKIIATKSYKRNIRGRVVSVNVHKRAKPRRFSGDQIAFLRSRLGMSSREATAKFNEEFGTRKSQNAIKTKMSRLRR